MKGRKRKSQNVSGLACSRKYRAGQVELQQRRKTNENIQIPLHGIGNVAFEADEDALLKSPSSARVEDVEYELLQPQYVYLRTDDDDDNDADEVEVSDYQYIGSHNIDYVQEDNSTSI